MEKVKEKKCPRCGYKLPQSIILLCPRCNMSLMVKCEDCEGCGPSLWKKKNNTCLDVDK